MLGLVFILFVLVCLRKKDYLKILRFLKNPDIPFLIMVVLPIIGILIMSIVVEIF